MMGPASRPGIEQRNIHPQHVNHAAVAGSGADEHTYAGAMYEHVAAQGDQQSGCDDQQAICRVAHAEKIDGSDQEFRHFHVIRRRAPDHARQLVEKQDQPESRQHLIQMIARIQFAQGDPVHRQAQREHRGHEQHCGKQE
jgi:hypothetical protein